MLINYTLPDFTSALGLNLFFARLYSEQPEMMRENVRIDSIYGCFPSCPLNGGRAATLEPFSREKVRWTFSVLEEYGLHARLTLTNMLAGERELNSPYSRMILEEAARANAQAIVYSDEVARVVKEHYGLGLVLSTTREILDAPTLNKALEKFDYVVLNYNLGKDNAFLSQIKNRDRLELMVNEYCQPNCPNRQKHYLHNSKDQLEGVLHEFACPANKPSFFEHKPGDPITFTADEVYKTAQDFGIEWFKIVGRGTGFDANLEALTYYLVKDEYHALVKQQVQNLRRS